MFSSKFFTWILAPRSDLTTAALGGLGEAEFGAFFDGLLQIEGAPIRPLTFSGKGEIRWKFAPTFVMAFSSKSCTCVFFTAAVGAFFTGLLPMETAPRPPITVSGKGAILWAQNWAHGSVSSIDAGCGKPRMPSACFTKATIKRKSMAMIRTQRQECFAQTFEETEIAEAAAKKTHLSFHHLTAVKAKAPAFRKPCRVKTTKLWRQKTSDKPAVQHHYIRHICRFNLGNAKLGAPTGRTSSASCRRFASPATCVQRAKCNGKKT